MSKALSDEAVAAYRRDGYYSPVRVMPATEASTYRKALEAHEARTGKPLQGNWRHKTTWSRRGSPSPAATSKAVA